ncbi:MAG: isochorismatase family cysteine hydrolase [Oscillospiraceae bacterium]
MRKVLVVVDYQKDFVDGSLGFNQSESISGAIYSLVARYVKGGDLVIFTKDTHGENYLSTREGKFLPVPHCIKGTEGHKLFGDLGVFEEEIYPNVIVLEKDVFGCEQLCTVIEEAFCGEPDLIEFCGVVTNICVLSNVIICNTHFKNAEIAVFDDATAAIGTAQSHSLEIMKGLGITVKSRLTY